jgi:hypothetical protein
MWTEDLRVSDDVSAAAWIAPRLTGGLGAVTMTVPAGYPAYARICHPAAARDGGWATWSQVAQLTGRQAHPTMQWHALVGSPDPFTMRGSLWPGSDPDRGNLVPEVLGPLCDLLSNHTATSEHCFFCLWEGYGWVHGGSAIAPTWSVPPGAPFPPDSSLQEWRRPAFSAEELSRQRVHLPHRDYLLLVGPLFAALQVGWRPTADWFHPQSPNLFWPADRAWCVASEVDFDSTLVGGTAELVSDILQAPALDSLPVQPGDSLAADADRINLIR